MMMQYTKDNTGMYSLKNSSIFEALSEFETYRNQVTYSYVDLVARCETFKAGCHEFCVVLLSCLGPL